MATESWVVDGINLTDLAYDIVTYDGLDITPSVQGENMRFFQTHGEKWVPKYHNAARKQLVMYVSSKDNTTGEQPQDIDGKRQNIDDNLDRLTLLFSRRRRTMEIVRTLSSGAVRQAQVECVATIEPVTVGLVDVKLSIELIVPSGFWEDTADSTLLDSTTGLDLVVSGAAGATAPMVGCEFAITGPATNPKVEDKESGSYFRYNGIVPAATVLTVKNQDMTIVNGEIEDMEHVGDSNWLTLYPTIADSPHVDFTASGTDANTNLVITGKRAYLR